jgi:hypothetical protein
MASIVWQDTGKTRWVQFHSNVGQHFFISQESPPVSPLGPMVFYSGSKSGVVNWSAAMKPLGAPTSYYSRGPRLLDTLCWHWYQETSLVPGTGTLMAMERGTFRRVFGGINRRVN